MKEDARNMNDQPDRFELFRLEDGEEKVTMEYDSRIPNTAIFHFAREDHTLGNLLAAALLQTDHVLFAAYKVPHPLFPTFVLRVSTSSETGPREALEDACRRVIQDLQNMAKQFTREWEIWKLTNEAAAGREDEETIEREKKMAEARKERDRVRAEMIMEEAAERALWDNSGLGGATWDNGGSREASPPWNGGNETGSRGGMAPWNELARSEAGSSAPWDLPTGDYGSDGGVSPAWDGGISANSENTSGRALWDEPSGSTSAPWNGTSYNPGGRSPTYEPPGSGRSQSYGGSPSRDRPTGGRSPTYEPSGYSGSQLYQSEQQAGLSSADLSDEPAAPLSRASWDEPELATGDVGEGAPWGGGSDNSYTSILRSPPRDLLDPGAASWDMPTREPQSDRAPTASDSTAGGRIGRVATHELHSFSASSAAGPPWGQGNDADDVYRDPNSEGEQAYLRRAAAAGSHDEGRSAWRQGSGNSGNNRSGGNNESGGNEDGRSPWDGYGDNGGDAGDGGGSPPWDGGFGGISPAMGSSDNKAPWDY